MNMLSDLPLRDMDESGWKALTEDYCVQFAGDISICVPKGYSSNGASIPRWLHWLVGTPWLSDYAEAALVHDWFCDTSTYSAGYNHRVMGDGIFWYLLHRNNVPYWKSALMYYAVRMNGILHFFITLPVKRWLRKQ